MKKVCLYLFFAGVFSFAIAASVNAIILGDINNDGKVDLTETIYSLQVVAGISNPLTNENEPNSKIDQANGVELGNPVAGKIATNGDTDFLQILYPPGRCIGYICNFCAG